MGDFREPPASGDQGFSNPETPAPDPAAAVLREFSRWLERWAVYARAQAGLAIGPEQAGQGNPAPDLPPAGSSSPDTYPARGEAPEHWQAAASQGPPAHWLALFAGQAQEKPASDLPVDEAHASEARAGSEGSPPIPQESESPEALIRRFRSELADFVHPLAADSALLQSDPAPDLLPARTSSAETEARAQEELTAETQPVDPSLPPHALPQLTGEGRPAAAGMQTEPASAVEAGAAIHRVPKPSREASTSTKQFSESPGAPGRHGPQARSEGDVLRAEAMDAPNSLASAGAEVQAPESLPASEPPQSGQPPVLSRLAAREADRNGSLLPQFEPEVPFVPPAPEKPEGSLAIPPGMPSPPADPHNVPPPTHRTRFHLRLSPEPTSTGSFPAIPQPAASPAAPPVPDSPEVSLEPAWSQPARTDRKEKLPSPGKLRIPRLRLGGSRPAPAAPRASESIRPVKPGDASLLARPLPRTDIPTLEESGRPGPESGPPRKPSTAPATALQASFFPDPEHTLHPSEPLAPANALSARPEPAWPERPKQARPTAVQWPPSDNQTHWPALPEAAPVRLPGPRPYQDPARRRRIDREQGGGSWKG